MYVTIFQFSMSFYQNYKFWFPFYLVCPSFWFVSYLVHPSKTNLNFGFDYIFHHTQASTKGRSNSLVAVSLVFFKTILRLMSIWYDKSFCCVGRTRLHLFDCCRFKGYNEGVILLGFVSNSYYGPTWYSRRTLSSVFCARAGPMRSQYPGHVITLDQCQSRSRRPKIDLKYLVKHHCCKNSLRHRLE